MLRRLVLPILWPWSVESSGTLQALNHPYFFALPNPTHPSKLPKPPSMQSSRPLDELDGNADPDSSGPGVKAAGPNKRKRKLSGSGRGGKTDRLVSRKLDFGSLSTGSS